MATFLKAAAADAGGYAGDIARNLAACLTAADTLAAEGARLICLPSAALTGNISRALAARSEFQRQTEQAALRLAAFTKSSGAAVVAGAVLCAETAVLSCALFMSGGGVRGVVPLETEDGGSCAGFNEINLGGYAVPFSKSLLFLAANGLTLGIAGCEAAARRITASGANTLVCCFSQEYAAAGAYESAKEISRSCGCGVIFPSAYKAVAEYGEILAAASPGGGSAMSDLDFTASYARRAVSGFSAAAKQEVTAVPFKLPAGFKLTRVYSRLPFVPKETDILNNILRHMQSELLKSMAEARANKVLLWLTAGFSDILCLLTAHAAFKQSGLNTEGIIIFTESGAEPVLKTLAAQLKVSVSAYPIRESVKAHLKRLSHGGAEDFTFTAALSRERARILTDAAALTGGAVTIGSTDLTDCITGASGLGAADTELISCTPKTLVKELLFAAAEQTGGAVKNILNAWLFTQTEPQPDKNRESRAAWVLELHDFFIYHLLFYGMSADNAALAASTAFPELKKKQISGALNYIINSFAASKLTAAAFSGAFSPLAPHLNPQNLPFCNAAEALLQTGGKKKINLSRR